MGKFFSYDPLGDGFEEHDTAEQAQSAAQKVLDWCQGEASDGWPEETDRIRWGVVLGEVVETEHRNKHQEMKRAKTPEEREDIESEFRVFDNIVSFNLVPVAGDDLEEDALSAAVRLDREAIGRLLRKIGEPDVAAYVEAGKHLADEALRRDQAEEIAHPLHPEGSAESEENDQGRVIRDLKVTHVSLNRDGTFGIGGSISGTPLRTCIINGEDWSIPSRPDDTIYDVRNRALAAADVKGLPYTHWLVWTEDGRRVPPAALAHNVGGKLFISLNLDPNVDVTRG